MNLLERLRVDRGLTLRDVVEQTGVSKSTLIRAEQGADLSAPTAKALADLYGMSGSELLIAHRDEIAEAA